MKFGANLSIPFEFSGARFSPAHENGGWEHPVIEDLYQGAGMWFPRRDPKALSALD